MATIAVGAGLVLEQRVISRLPVYTFEGLRVVRVDPDWFLVQRHPNGTADGYVSVVVDLHGVVYCTCPSGLARVGCQHVRAVGELLPIEPPRPERRTPSTTKNVGSRNGRAKLTEHQAAEIRWLVEHTKLRQQDIAERYRVSSALVSDIARGHRWVGVPPRQPPPATQKLIRVTTATWPAEPLRTANVAGPIPVGRALPERVAAADD